MSTNTDYYEEDYKEEIITTRTTKQVLNSPHI